MPRLRALAAAGALAAAPALAADLERPPEPLASPPALDRVVPAAAAPLEGRISLGGAIRQALARNANILVQAQQVRAGEGGVQQARGAYDPEIVGRAERNRNVRPLNATERATLPAQYRDEWNWSTAYRLGVERTLESGARLTTGFGVASNVVNTQTVAGTPQQTAGNLNFSLRVPLQRGAGGIQFSTALRAAEYERGAAVEELLQTGAGTVLAVVQAYWEIAARRERIRLLQVNGQRAAELVSELRKLIAADQIPAAELHLALASEAEKRAARVAEEQALQQAWTTLGRLLQADAGDAMSAGIVTDALPAIPADVARLPAMDEALAAGALERRADVRAARLRERAAYELLRAAQDNLRPQVDLIAGATSNTLAEGASSLALGPALTDRRADPSINVAVEVRWPWRNETASGLLLARSAAHDQATIRLRDTERSVAPAVLAARAGLRSIAARHAQTESAVERFAITVKNELAKRRLGLATLIDVITVQDRLDGAQLGRVQLQQEYAVAVAQLLFDTGALVVDREGRFAVDLRPLGGATGGAP